MSSVSQSANIVIPKCNLVGTHRNLKRMCAGDWFISIFARRVMRIVPFFDATSASEEAAAPGPGRHGASE